MRRTDRSDNPWRVDDIDRELVSRLAARHVANTRTYWARLSDARSVTDVVSGSAVLLGSPIGRHLAKVVAWDFGVSDDDPLVSLELLPIRASEIARLLGRNRTSAG